MTIITQTVYANALAMQQKIGKPYEPLQYSTINEALSNPNAIPNQPAISTAGSEVFDEYDADTDTRSFLMKYMVIGNNGHQTIFGENMHTGMPAAMDWASNNSGLYNMIPFLMVPIDQPLSPSQRNKYRLRKVLQVGNELYEAYYALVISFPDSPPDYRIFRKENNQIIDSQTFQPTQSQLIPVHPQGDLTNNKTHVSATQPYSAIFTTEMINNIINACVLLYGSAATAVISEIGICHGVEKAVTARYPTSGTQTPVGVSANAFYEIVATQVDTHVSLVQPISNNHVGFSIALDVGSGSPLYPTSTTQG